MTQHTKGPWTLGEWVRGHRGDAVYRMVFGAGRKLSIVGVYGHKPDGEVGGRKLKAGGHAPTHTEAQCDADIRLIAAAPELFDALTNLLAASERHIFSNECKTERDAARAALRLAELGE